MMLNLSTFQQVSSHLTKPPGYRSPARPMCRRNAAFVPLLCPHQRRLTCPPPLQFRHVQCLGQHAATMGDEEAQHRMHLKYCAFQDRAERYARLHPPARDPECHQRCNAQAGGDWQSFEVGSFAVGIFRNAVGRDVEACKSCQAT